MEQIYTGILMIEHLGRSNAFDTLRLKKFADLRISFTHAGSYLV